MIEVVQDGIELVQNGVKMVQKCHQVGGNREFWNLDKWVLFTRMEIGGG